MKFDLSNLRGDVTGGITAGIVALPLALALGVASGLGPLAGLYGAIAVGFFWRYTFTNFWPYRADDCCACRTICKLVW